MPIPGYDPDDLDELLAERLEARGGPSLTPRQWREYENGATLFDVLTESEIERLLHEE
ncbi:MULTISPECIES: hypothetical protein [unclassified Haladaptatus]|uniref:hypothetical protein n=1 Tax=unclassified Haladaptatus TaxID=2622732 RepID=UPI000AD74BE3|nr:hypothetical protein [Haladaptatus sp. R4]